MKELYESSCEITLKSLILWVIWIESNTVEGQTIHNVLWKKNVFTDMNTYYVNITELYKLSPA